MLIVIGPEKQLTINFFKHYFGKLIREGNISFFEFNNEDIEFVILPRRYENKFKKTLEDRPWEVRVYEDLMGSTTRKRQRRSGLKGGYARMKELKNLLSSPFVLQISLKKALSSR